MIKEKDKVVNEMMQLISKMNCSDSHCEDCCFKSHCCMCVGALELLYDNGYRKVSKDSVIFTREEWEDLHKKIDEDLHYTREQVRKETGAFVLKDIVDNSLCYVSKRKLFFNLCGDIILKIAKQLGFIEEDNHEK